MVRGFTDTGVKRRFTVVTLLWILAVVLVVAGIFAIFRGQMLWGIVLIIVGLLVGPGGVSVFT
jgi:fatty acid desaturase